MMRISVPSPMYMAAPSVRFTQSVPRRMQLETWSSRRAFGSVAGTRVDAVRLVDEVRATLAMDRQADEERHGSATDVASLTALSDDLPGPTDGAKRTSCLISSPDGVAMRCLTEKSCRRWDFRPYGNGWSVHMVGV